MKLSTVFAAAASLVATANAHGGVGTYTIGSTAYPGSVHNPFTSSIDTDLRLDGRLTTQLRGRSLSSVYTPASTLSSLLISQ